MPASYLEFADLFSKLTPFELRHFSEVLLCKIEDVAEGQLLGKQRYVLNEKDIKYALTEAMRDIAIQQRERILSEGQLDLTKIKAQLFALPSVA